MGSGHKQTPGIATMTAPPMMAAQTVEPGSMQVEVAGPLPRIHATPVTVWLADYMPFDHALLSDSVSSRAGMEILRSDLRTILEKERSDAQWLLKRVMGCRSTGKEILRQMNEAIKDLGGTALVNELDKEEEERGEKEEEVPHSDAEEDW